MRPRIEYGAEVFEFLLITILRRVLFIQEQCRALLLNPAKQSGGGNVSSRPRGADQITHRLQETAFSAALLSRCDGEICSPNGDQIRIGMRTPQGDGCNLR